MQEECIFFYVVQTPVVSGSLLSLNPSSFPQSEAAVSVQRCKITTGATNLFCLQICANEIAVKITYGLLSISFSTRNMTVFLLLTGSKNNTSMKRSRIKRTSVLLSTLKKRNNTFCFSSLQTTSMSTLNNAFFIK